MLSEEVLEIAAHPFRVNVLSEEGSEKTNCEELEGTVTREKVGPTRDYWLSSSMAWDYLDQQIEERENSTYACQSTD